MSNIIQKPDIGIDGGRFGNQLFQYAFGKTYANRYNCDLKIPSDWQGRNIFEINDGCISSKLERMDESNFNWGKVNVDLYGLFYNPKYISITTKKRT